MNHKALIQLGAELMHGFRHGEGPADKAFADYTKKRGFLGATDKRFLGDIFFYTLRHMRRIDEAILSGFSEMVVAEERYSSGFPVTSPMGARAWERRAPGEREAQNPRHRYFDRSVDTLRLGLAAVEQKLEEPAVVAEELERSWPHLKEKKPPRAETLARMIEHAAGVLELFGKQTKPIALERRFSFPFWLWGSMSFGRTEDELIPFGEALNQPAPVGLRVNTLKASVEEAFEALEETDLEYRPGELSETAVLLKKRYPNRALPHYREGWFEVQDEGSQLVGRYAAPAPGMTVVDACAGGGGKALHLAALMQNQGRLVALDAEPARLTDLPNRAKRAGVSILDTTLKYDMQGNPPAQLEPADLVLIDAPCSGTGTLRRSPEIRWRLSQSYLEWLRNTQRRLLAGWAEKVKPGGHLVYATCSLLSSENSYQTEAFLAEHPAFELDPPEGLTGGVNERGELVVEPHRHGTDGFYAARLRRRE